MDREQMTAEIEKVLQISQCTCDECILQLVKTLNEKKLIAEEALANKDYELREARKQKCAAWDEKDKFREENTKLKQHIDELKAKVEVRDLALENPQKRFWKEVLQILGVPYRDSCTSAEYQGRFALGHLKGRAQALETMNSALENKLEALQTAFDDLQRQKAPDHREHRYASAWVVVESVLKNMGFSCENDGSAGLQAAKFIEELKRNAFDPAVRKQAEAWRTVVLALYAIGFFPQKDGKTAEEAVEFIEKEHKTVNSISDINKTLAHKIDDLYLERDRLKATLRNIENKARRANNG